MAKKQDAIGINRSRPLPACPYCHKPQDSKFALKRHKEFCSIKSANMKGWNHD